MATKTSGTTVASAMLALALALLPVAGRAQALPGGAQLGMSAEQLQQAVPALERVARPVRMGGGLAGNWRGPGVDIGGIRMAPTYFFAEAQLRRIEYMAAPGAGANAFDALLAWGRAAWGAELASQEPEGRYAAWKAGDVDAYLQQTSVQQQAQVRLVVQRRVQKDAGEL